MVVQVEALQYQNLIPSFRVPGLVKLVDLYNRKAKKLKLPALAMSISEDAKEKEFVTEIHYKGDQHTTMRKRIVLCKTVTIQGDIPCLDGWSLVATKAVLSNGEVMLSSFPGKKVPKKFRGNGMECNHCNYTRRRKNLVILSKGKKFVQVGKSCMKDFIPTNNIQKILEHLSYLYKFNSYSDLGSEGGSSVRSDWGGWDVLEILSLATNIIRKDGFFSKEMERYGRAEVSTATVVRCVKEDIDSGRSRNPVEDEDLEFARKVYAWGMEISKNTNNDYMYNLGVSCRQSYVTGRTLGIVVSAIPAYKRYMESKSSNPNKTSKVSEFQGEIGERIEVEVTPIKSFSFSTIYGGMTIHILEDQNGNKFTWGTSTYRPWGDNTNSMIVKARVKKHEIYNDVKQTVPKNLSVVSTVKNSA